jgi:hypothetical protein
MRVNCCRLVALSSVAIGLVSAVSAAVRVQGEWAERCSRLGQGAGPCIRKCAGALEVLP